MKSFSVLLLVCPCSGGEDIINHSSLARTGRGLIFLNELPCGNRMLFFSLRSFVRNTHGKTVTVHLPRAVRLGLNSEREGTGAGII